MTAQLSHQASVVASILERHTAELTAAQEWDSEWNSQGLLSRLSAQVRDQQQPVRGSEEKPPVNATFVLSRTIAAGN